MNCSVNYKCCVINAICDLLSFVNKTFTKVFGSSFFTTILFTKEMDRVLRPERFDTESTAFNAEKKYKHWKLMFMNYLHTVNGTEETGNTQTDFYALINSISADVYEIISDTSDYASAMRALDAAYIRPTNIVYNRHQLITMKQQPAQTVDSFRLQLENLAKTCNFQAVSAETNKSQYMREAFISGISSFSIRQRLLEKSSLTFREAYEMARSLEQAEKHSACYNQESVISAPIIASGENTSLAATQKRKRGRRKFVFSAGILVIRVAFVQHGTRTAISVRKKDTGPKSANLPCQRC